MDEEDRAIVRRMSSDKTASDGMTKPASGLTKKLTRQYSFKTKTILIDTGEKEDNREIIKEKKGDKYSKREQREANRSNREQKGAKKSKREQKIEKGSKGSNKERNAQQIIHGDLYQ